MKLQNKFTTAQATLIHRNDTIDTLHKQIDELQNRHTGTISELAVLKVKLETTVSKKPTKKLAEAV